MSVFNNGDMASQKHPKQWKTLTLGLRYNNFLWELRAKTSCCQKVVHHKTSEAKAGAANGLS